MTSLAQIDRYRPRWRAKRSGWLILVLLNGIAESLSHAQTAEPTPPGPVHQVLQDHCWKCHDAETAKGRLSLEQTPARFAETHLQDRWTRVFDRIARHEMPPTNQPALGREDRELLLGWLQENLTQSSREHQLREGRSPLRRLSRNEYAHAVNDLFGLRVEVLDLLPEDTRVAGFDKLTRGLDISSQHWLRYQQAAHRVVEAAFPDRPPNSKRSYQTGRQWLEQQRRRGGKSAELALKYGAQVEGNSVTLYAQSLSHPYLQLEVGMPSEPGRYRLRGSVRARGHGGQPLPLLILLTGYNPIEDPTLQRVVDVKDIPEAAAPRIIDLEILVPHFSERWKTQSVALAGWSLPQQPQLGALEAQAVLGQPPDFSGPGITVEWVEFEGPLGSATSPGNRPLITALPDANPAASAEELVGRLARHLLRRPLSDEVTAEYRRYFAQQLERGGSASQAAKFTCEAMLCSPHFLFRQEAPGRLDHAAIATRLAAFLWNSVPDEALLRRAHQAQWSDPGSLHAEVERMLDDPRASRLTEDLALQWLELRNLHATTPDTMYDEFDAPLLWSMPRETYGFLATLLRENRPIGELVRSDWTFLNERLARHYGIQNIAGWELRKATLPPGSHRGGVLTHASVLKITANGTSTSPVLRGKWVLDRILGQPPSPPPPDTPAIEPDIRGASTIRQQLEKHRQLASCAQCHRWIDPPGFALENYDVIGGWREWYRVKAELNGRASVPNYPTIKVWKGPAVEQGYQTATGKPFANMEEYRALLLEDQEQIARNVLQRLVSYATGAEIQFADRAVIEDILRQLRPAGFRFRDLIHAVIQSRMFLEK